MPYCCKSSRLVCPSCFWIPGCICVLIYLSNNHNVIYIYDCICIIISIIFIVFFLLLFIIVIIIIIMIIIICICICILHYCAHASWWLHFHASVPISALGFEKGQLTTPFSCKLCIPNSASFGNHSTADLQPTAVIPLLFFYFEGCRKWKWFAA